MVITTNNSAVNTARFLSQSTDALRKSLSRLSSGSRIVSPEDDAAGLAQAARVHNESLRAKAAGENLQNAMSFLQTRDGGLQKIQKAFDRMGELAMLALDATKTDTDRENYNNEFKTLFSAIGEIAGTSFNGKALFRSFQLEQIGANTWAAAKADAEAKGGHLATITSASKMSEIVRDVGDFTTTAWFGLSDHVTEGTFKWVTGEPLEYTNWFGAEPSHTGNQDFVFLNWSDNTQYTWNDGGSGGSDATTYYLLEKGIDIDFTTDADGASFTFSTAVLPSVATGSIATIADANAALSELKTAIGAIASQRAETGAAIRRVESQLEAIKITAENLDASVSRIMDVDVALESTNLARQSILTQSGTAMLAQANSLPQIVLRLLG